VYSNSSLSTVISNLNPSSVYEFRISASNQAGTSKPSGSLVVSTLPSAPSAPPAPIIVDVQSTSLVVQWSASKNLLVNEFHLFVAEDNGPFRLAYRGSDSHTLVSKLKPYTSYRFRLRALNSFGASPFTETVAKTSAGPPSQPMPPFVVSKTTASIELAWNRDNMLYPTDVSSWRLEATPIQNSLSFEAAYAASSVSGFELVYSGSSDSFEVVDLVQNRAYIFRLQAINGLGSGVYSVPVTFSSFGSKSLPDTPLRLQAPQTTGDSISLRWSVQPQSPTSELTYVVERTQAFPRDSTLDPQNDGWLQLSFDHDPRTKHLKSSESASLILTEVGGNNNMAISIFDIQKISFLLYILRLGVPWTKSICHNHWSHCWVFLRV
jgi:protein sidekick